MSGTANQILGGIAQLGERLNGIQEVSGSIPLISTKGYSGYLLKSPEIERFQDFFFVFGPKKFRNLLVGFSGVARLRNTLP